MASIDNRIVHMEFDNASFERKIESTLASLASLDKALDFSNAQKNLADVSSAVEGVNFEGMAEGIDSIASKFSALGAIGFSVIQSLTQSILGFAKQFAGDLFGPIISGGLDRAKNIEQAQFMFRGLGLDVEQAMASAKAAVLGTAYGLDQAAKTAAQFGAAGVAVGQDMTDALRGVAGAAAMTGSSFSEIGYIFSGIAGAGKVNTQDLMQFATRGLNAAAAIGKAMGKTEQEIRDMVSNGELDFKTFATAMNVAFGEHATQANETFTGSVANMKAALSRLGASFFTPQLINFRDIFNTLTPKIDQFTAAIKPALDIFSLLSREVAGIAFKNILGLNFDSLKAAMPAVVTGMVNIFRTIQDIANIGKYAFQQIFPPGAVPLIQKVATAFANFSAHLTVTVDGMTRIKSIFVAVFSALSIGWEIVKEGAKFFFNLAKSIAGLFGSDVSNALEKVTTFITNLQGELVKGGGIKDFFSGLTAKMKGPIEFLGKAKDAITNLFGGFKKETADAVGNAAQTVSDRFSNLRDRLENFWDPFLKVAETVIGVIVKVGAALKTWFGDLINDIAAGMGEGDFSAVLDALNTGLLGAIALFLKKFLDNGLSLSLLPQIDGLKGVLDGLTGSLNAMQTKLKTDALLKIAEAVALLTVSVVALSLIDSAALTKALTAMAVGFAQLIASFAALEKLSVGPKGAVDFGAITTGLVILAGAMLVLSIAVKILSTIDWEGLAKGLGGVIVLLGALVLAVKPLSASSKGMFRAGLGIIEIAAGMVILAVAMKIMSTLSWEEMAKGLVGVAGGLGAVVLAMNLMPNKLAMVKAGASILAIAVALAVLGGAVHIFASLDWESLGKGLLGLAVSLGIVVLAIRLMPKDMGSSAAGILLVAVAIAAMAVAIKLIGGMSWESIAKGLIGIAVSMAILVGAALAMEAGIPGAAAMVVVAGALLVLSKVIKTIGKLSWEELIRGLVGLAAGIVIIAAAAILLTPAIPEILALGVALILLGAGIALIGAGAYLLARAFQVMTKTLVEATVAIPAMFEAIGDAIPAFLKGIAEGIVDVVKVIAKAAPIIAKALGTLLEHIINTLIVLTPKFGQLISAMLDEAIRIIWTYTQPLIDAGMHILLSFLQGISDNIEQIVTLVADIITKFLDGMTNETDRVVTSLVDLFTTFFLSTSEGLGEVAATIMVGSGQAFIQGFLDGAVNQLNGPVFTWITNLLGTVLSWIGDTSTWLLQKGIDIMVGLLNGIVSAAVGVYNFFTGLPGQIIGFFAGAIDWLAQAGSDILNGLKNGIEATGDTALHFLSTIHNKVWGFFSGAIDWLVDIGKDILEGLLNGMKSAWHKVEGFLGDITDAIPFKKGPPAKDKVMLVESGQLIMQGLHTGMQDGWSQVSTWLESLDPAQELNDSFGTSLSKTISDVAASLNDAPEFNPTITPILDLTKVAAEATKIGGYLDTSQLSSDASFQTAQVISSAELSKGDSSSTTTDATPTKEIQFNQVINAPTELSASDIYKQTRNQLTMAKEALSIP